jgi:outer membrane protein OmpA-like peptidoglycan-associated protein
MIKSGRGLIWMIGIPIALLLAASGCATKKYVSQQVAPVNQRLSQFEKQTNDRLAWLNNREQTDMSRLNERIATTDQRVSQLSSAVQHAQGTASRAMEEADTNKTGISANSTAISTLESNVANSLNYQLVEKADITFGFDKAVLTPEARLALDQIVSKVQSMPRAVVELSGFTDPIGSKEYNLALSRRRAWAVQRYLVEHKVSPRSIHVVGMGKEMPPDVLEADLQTINPNPSRAELNRLARRVHIRVFGAGDITSASRSQQ